jgi:hypothetical protein
MSRQLNGHAGGERGGEQVRQRDDDLVRVALGALDVEEALGAGAARLVDDDQRFLHQLVLDDDALDQARHLVGAAARAGGHDELHRLGRLPRGLRRARERHRRRLPRAIASGRTRSSCSQSESSS